MKPSINAFFGYSYQECISFLMIAKMDVERQIKKVEIETLTDNNFDDIKLLYNDAELFCQIKDYGNISLSDITFENNIVIINGLRYVLSDGINLLFFKNIELEYNDQILDFPAYKKSNTYIISLSREQAIIIINNLYKYNEYRITVIKRFFEICLDKRQLNIRLEELPPIDLYNINLIEKTIDIGKRLLEFEDVLFIEGKPGVGKSHLVNCLTKEFKNSLVYRFWVSNQDKDYRARLFFQNFLTNISKDLFRDYRHRSEDEIIDHLHNKKMTIIIDGLDHVESYQNSDLPLFIDFINKAKSKCKIIVLSRPLMTEIKWKRQQLTNWNFEETKSVIDGLYHISDYSTCRKIFDITDGYPILVRFVTEHFKNFHEITETEKIKSIDEYYDKITTNSKILTALALFLSSRSFIMESEISLFLEAELPEIIREFIRSHPYLFEIKLNRISFFHDSLNTYLRSKEIDYASRSLKVKQIVHQSLMKGEQRFMSRFGFFNLDKHMKVEIIKKYANIEYFNQISKTCIDFEAIKSFYQQIRETITELESDELEIIHYYDLSLIINITTRDHISTVNEFLFTYINCILFNGYGDDDITSSEYLFCMYYFIKQGDATLLYNITSDSHYNTEYFYQNLEYDVLNEKRYFIQHKDPLKRTKKLNAFLNQEFISDLYEYFPNVLANLYLHKTKIKELRAFQSAIRQYINENEDQGKYTLKNALLNYKNINDFLSETYLARAKDIILSLGYDPVPNEYHNDSLKKMILNNACHGSFYVWPKVLNYIRLSLYEDRKIDLSSIGYFFYMYHNRKDVSVISLDEALRTFEYKGLIDEVKSIEIIVKTQSMSEKGIRHLLKTYIELHEPKIITTILKKYNPDKLEITWFDLHKKFINHFPDYLFDFALHSQLLKWNGHSKTIDFKDIQNVFNSKRKKQLINTLNFFRYTIKITDHHSSLLELQTLGCLISIIVPEDNDYSRTTEERFAQGLLDSDSINFIKKKNLRPEEISGYTNGYYSVFADLDVYKAYDSQEVKSSVLPILKNALLGKIQNINMYASLYYLPGNLPKFMNEYNIDVDFSKLYNSLMTFLDISLIYQSNKNNPGC